MYQKKQSVKPSVRVFSIIFLLVFAFTLNAEDGIGEYYDGPSVDEIFNDIRHSEDIHQWKESVETFQNEGMTVVCSLAVPQTRRRPPVTLLLAGFFGTRKGADIPGANETDFERVRRKLAEQGIAVLRVDFRGSGDSDGDFSMTTFSSQISDVIAAIDFIETDLRYRVNPRSIGIVGFSQGGTVAAIVAARDSRVDSIVLWSAPAHLSHDYEGVLSKEGIKQGLSLTDGESITLPFTVEGTFLWDVPLKRAFFEELFTVEPLAESYRYKKPMMYVAGKNDVVVWPQPAVGNTYLKYHRGFEKLVTLDADHSLGYWDGPEPVKYDDAIYWSAAWFMKTLKVRR